MDIADDLRLYAKLDGEILTRFLELVSNEASKVVDRASILREVETKLDADDDIRGLFRVVNHLASELSVSRDFEASFSETESVILELTKDDDEAVAGWEKLKKHPLFVDVFLFSRKEQDLKERFNRFSSIDVTIDIRPVFDFKREEIRKLIHTCIMKVKGDEEDIVLEVYEDDIDEIIGELQRAKKKLGVVKDRFK